MKNFNYTEYKNIPRVIISRDGRSFHYNARLDEQELDGMYPIKVDVLLPLDSSEYVHEDFFFFSFDDYFTPEGHDMHPFISKELGEKMESGDDMIFLGTIND